MASLGRLWPQGGLWRHADFLKLWSAETISQFGTAITGLALPLVAIIVLDASAFEVAALGTIAFAPFTDALTIGQLYVVGFLVGTLTVFFDVAYQSYLPSLVERRDLV